jgi:glycosyltransferase involved in cell wall biosynthesis
VGDPRLSVVMPNYNDAAYIREAIDAILSQSYADFELIIVDDGSTDDSFRIITEYAQRDPRVRVFKNEQNSGCIPTVNKAISFARGEFLYQASSNDKVLPGFFEKTVALMDQFPNAALCLTDPSHFFESYGPIYCRRTGLTEGAAFLSPADLVKLYRTGRFSAPLHSSPAMLRRAPYEAAGGCLPELRWYCDFFVTTVMAFRSGMCYLPEALTTTRILQRSYWRSGTAQRQIQAEVRKTLLDLLLSSRFQDVMPPVKESGILSYFGLPMLRQILGSPVYRGFFEFRNLRRTLWNSFKHGFRGVASLRMQRFYFWIRDLIRSRTSGIGRREVGQRPSSVARS